MSEQTTPPHPTAPARGERETAGMRSEWWCMRCEQTVPPEHVTFEERHDERAGGCGEAVVANLVPTPTGAGEVVDWRKELWLGHGCPLPALYGDDGEMQCCACMLDFRRDTPELIARRWADQLHSAREEAGRLGRTMAQMERQYQAGERAWERQVTAYNEARLKAEREAHEARSHLAARDAELAGVRADAARNVAKYGRHLPTCDTECRRDAWIGPAPCTCGFDIAARSGAGQEG